MKSAESSIAAPKQNLARLLIIRWLLVLCLLAGMAVAQWVYEVNFLYRTVLWLVGFFVLFNVFAWWRLRQSWPVTAVEFFVQIILDILAVTLLFYFSGGASNPFISYYLVPVTISIVTLPWRFTWALALLSIACYTMLLFYNVPIPDISPDNAHAHHGSQLNAHIVGMWFNFIMSVGLIAYFVVRMSNALKAQQQLINQHREESLRDEQVLAVATLAAGTAHELGSPLTTMKLLINEMLHDYDEPSLKSDLSVLKQQVDVCSQTLKGLVHRVESSDDQDGREVCVEDFCKAIISRWLVLRPDVVSQVNIQKQQQELRARFHYTVDQAIINLLNNAADASHEKVVVNMGWNNERVTIDIIDDGEGIPSDVKAQLGQAFVTTKGRGLGLGLFLSNATIARCGGALKIEDRIPQGTRLTVVLPLVSLI